MSWCNLSKVKIIYKSLFFPKLCTNSYIYLFQIAPIYELDTTDLTQWDELVTKKAIHIIDSHLNGTPCDYAPTTVPTKEEKRKIDGNSYNYCEVCNRVMIGDNVYEIHLKSVRHMRVLKKKKQVQSSDIDENSE